jgi:hypothetical protein
MKRTACLRVYIADSPKPVIDRESARYDGPKGPRRLGDLVGGTGTASNAITTPARLIQSALWIDRLINPDDFSRG